jgi:hypothetical protein
MKFLCLLLASASVVAVTAFTPSSDSNNKAAPISRSPTLDVSRADFMKNAAFLTGAAAVIILPTEPAFARGHATNEETYDRYVPRILAGGKFYAKDLRTMIGKDDWAGIKAALQEPPKRSSDDKKKVDGGIAERAAQAGGFSASRVLSACDLFAAGFSDNSLSAKTKKMKVEVEALRTIVEEMGSTARQALGDESGGGGLFGLVGGKKLSKGELQKKMRELYGKGGGIWNQYIFVANEELPLQFKKLPYL